MPLNKFLPQCGRMGKTLFSDETFFYDLLTCQWSRLFTTGRLPEARSGHSAVVVGDSLDAADDWIVEHVEADDIVITADIPLAGRCLGAGAMVIGHSGRPFTEQTIGEALATRELLAELRGGWEVTGGPPPLTKRDRSHFLQQLDNAIQFIRRKHSLDAT